MSWQYKHQTVVDGIVVKYDPCDHCDRLPTEKDIRDQLAIVERNRATPCVVCGEKAKVIEIEIRHFKDRSIDRWGGDVIEMEPMEKLSGYWQGKSIELPVHPRCAAKALPNAKIPV
jgi:hypothetical protein